MIHAARPLNPEDVVGALNKRFPKKEGQQQGQTELEQARIYYATVPPPTKAYSFARYKEWEVCRALDSLFREKCAYCESSYRAVDSRNVEHFRPKGAVSEAPHHPGYWWLAADWSNLLPSCPPCNQKRRQLSYDPNMTLEEFERARLKEPDKTSGKANSFPLLQSNWVTNENDSIAAEEPLLINPCDREPSAHLEWVFDWDRKELLWHADPVTALLRPRANVGVDDPYAKASIAVYGLNRAGLVRERMARIKDMQVGLRPIVDAMADLTGTPEGGRKWNELKDRLARYKKNFHEAYVSPERPYAGMAGAFLTLFETELPKLDVESTTEQSANVAVETQATEPAIGGPPRTADALTECRSSSRRSVCAPSARDRSSAPSHVAVIGPKVRPQS